LRIFDISGAVEEEHVHCACSVATVIIRTGAYSYVFHAITVYITERRHQVAKFVTIVESVESAKVAIVHGELLSPLDVKTRSEE